MPWASPGGAQGHVSQIFSLCALQIGRVMCPKSLLCRDASHLLTVFFSLFYSLRPIWICIQMLRFHLLSWGTGQNLDHTCKFFLLFYASKFLKGKPRNYNSFSKPKPFFTWHVHCIHLHIPYIYTLHTFTDSIRNDKHKFKQSPASNRKSKQYIKSIVFLMAVNV